METPEWLEETNGIFAARTERFNFSVLRANGGQIARFVVMARWPAASDTLVGSGMQHSVGEAMRVAEAMARHWPALALRPAPALRQAWALRH